MKDMYKSKKQLIQELEEARRQLSQKAAATPEAGAAREDSTHSAVQEALMLIRKAIDSVTDAIGISDLEGHHIYQNKAFTNLFEYTADELESAGGGTAAFAVKNIAREVFGAIMNGKTWSGEVEMKAKSGRLFSLFLRADAIKDDAGKIAGLVGVFTDISERKHLEYELRKRHDELQLILDSIPAYVFYKDKNGKMLNINKAAASLAYVPKEKLLQRTVFDLTPQAADQYNRDDMDVISSGEPKLNIEEPLLLPGGTRWLKTDKLPVKDDQGKVTGLVGFSVDITELKSAQEELRQKEALLNTFFNSPGLICGIVELEVGDLRYVTVNAAFAEMYGLKPEDVSNRLASEVGTDRAIVELFVDNYKKSQKNNAPVYFEYKRGVGKETRWLFVTVTFLGLEPVRYRPRFAFVTSDITERRKAEEALRTSETKLRQMFETMTDAVVLTDLNGNILDVNASALKTFGYKKDEVVGRNGLEVLSFDDQDRALKNLAESTHGAETAGIQEYRILDKNNRVVSAEINVNRLIDVNSKPYGFVVVVRDVTEKKTVEAALRESEAKYRFITEKMTDVVWTLDMNLNSTYVSPSCERMLGYTTKERLCQPVQEQMTPESLERVMKLMAAELEREGREGVDPDRKLTIDVEYYHKNGSTVWTENVATAIRDGEGKPVGLHGVSRDISERKKAEEALRNSEEKLRLMFASMADGVVVTDLEGKIIDVNEAQLRMFGFKDKSELLGRGGFDFLAVRERDRALADMYKVYETGFNTGSTYTVADRSGREFECELSTAVLHDAARRPSGAVTVMRDVTERRKTQKALRETNEKLRVIFDTIGEAVTVVDLDGNIVDANKEALSLHGFSNKDEIIGRKASEVVALIDRDRAVDDAIKALRSSQPLSRREYKLVKNNGAEFDGEFNVAVMKDDKGQPAGFIGVSRDVSERKRTAEMLNKSEKYFKAITENSSDIVIITDKNGDIKYCSPSMERFSGYKTEDLIGKSGFDFIHPDDVQRAVGDFGKAILTKGVTMPNAFRIVHKDGSTRFFDGLGKNLLDDPSIEGFIMNIRDVTERIGMEEALKNSEEKLRVMFDSMMDGIVVSDPNINIVDINKAALEIIGDVSKEELIGRLATDVIKFKDQEAVIANLAKMMQERRPQEKMEYSVVFLSGREMDIEVSTAMMHDRAGNLIGFVNAIRDISERKKWEDSLRKSEEKYRNLAETTTDIVYSIDNMGNLTFIGPQVARYGLNYEKMVGRHLLDFIYLEDREKVLLDFDRTAKSGAEFPTEFRVLDADGNAHWIEEMGRLQRDSSGAITGTTGVLRDITERKRSENALKDSEMRFRHIMENSQDASYRRNLKTNEYDYLSPVITKLTGYTVEEITTMSESAVVELIHSEDREQVKRIFADALSGISRTYQVEYRFMCRDGQYRWMTDLGSIMLDEAGQPQFLVGSLRDITERKQAEAKIIVLFNAFMAAQDAVLIFDMQGRVINANEAAQKLFERDQFGVDAMEAVVPEDKERIAAALAEMITSGRPAVAQFSIVTMSGRRVPIEASGSLVLDAGGKPVGIVVVERDLTERRKAEEALKKSEEKYRNLVEREKDVIVSVDALGFVNSVNSAVSSWGYTPDEVMKMNFLDLIAPEWREVTAVELQNRLLKTGEFIGETLVLDKNGNTRPIEYSAVVVKESGEYAGAQAIVRDISDRKRAEEAIQAKERYFRAITDLSSGAALIVNSEGVITDVTGGLERISGYTREGTIGHVAMEFIHPGDLEKAGAAFNEALLNPDRTVAFEARLKNSRGEWQWTESMITNLMNHRDIKGIVNHMIDITERKKAEENIRNHAKRIEALYSVAQVISQSSMLEAMLNDSLDRVCNAMDTESGCIFMLDLDENALKLKAWRGVPGEAVQQFSSIELTDGGLENLVNLTGPITAIDETQDVVDPEKMKKVTEDLRRKGIAAVPFFRGKDFQGLIVVFTSADRAFSGEDLDLFKAVANEISIGINNIMLMEKTKEMSVTDELTGLYNRRYFFEMLEIEMNRAGRTKHPFALVMIDLDGFKEYNDKYGHTNGDNVLQTFSQTLKASLRKSDMAFRYGGDEFVLILPMSDAEKAKKVMERIRSKWQREPLTQSKIFGGHVGFSSGIAEYPENAESPDGLIFLADAALYQAKKKGHEDKLVSELRTLSSDIMDVATQDQVYALAATVDARDPYTYGHSQRVAEIAISIGKQIGLSTEDLSKLHAAALLHDIGKVGVPDAILTKEGKPTMEEWDVIRKHCAEGARILSYVKELSTLVPIVLHHHEWYDGTGYPGGLRGLDIPSGARITSVADAYDTMVTKRPYRDTVSPKEACEELKRNAGTQFDPVIVDVWCKLVEKEEKPGR